jgi:hypothetical protein
MHSNNSFVIILLGAQDNKIVVLTNNILMKTKQNTYCAVSTAVVNSLNVTMTAVKK